MSTTYEPSAELAASEAEGGAVNLTDREWPALGIWPDDDATAVYEDEKQPVAETDNAWNRGVRDDEERLNAALGDLERRMNTAESDIDTLRTDLDALEAAFNTHNHDDRYYRKHEVYTKTESEDRYVNETGDTMTGDLDMSGNDFLGVKYIVSESGPEGRLVTSGGGADSWVVWDAITNSPIVEFFEQTDTGDALPTEFHRPTILHERTTFQSGVSCFGVLNMENSIDMRDHVLNNSGAVIFENHDSTYAPNGPSIYAKNGQVEVADANNNRTVIS